MRSKIVSYELEQGYFFNYYITVETAPETRENEEAN